MSRPDSAPDLQSTLGLEADLVPGGLRAAVEAVLMVTDEPVPLEVVAAALEVRPADVEAVVTSLAREYDEQGRGFELRGADAGWRIYSRRDLAPVVQRFVAEATPPRLSRAALETLAIVAYRQPVTRAVIASIRGVSADTVLRTLLARGLVEEVGSEPSTGAALFGPTALLFEKLGLPGPDALPPLAPFLPDVDDVPDAPAAAGDTGGPTSGTGAGGTAVGDTTGADP